MSEALLALDCFVVESNRSSKSSRFLFEAVGAVKEVRGEAVGLGGREECATLAGGGEGGVVEASLEL